MKKFSNKITAGLMASFIGLSPIIGSQVSAMFDGVEISQNQVKPIEDCSKEELLQRLPSLWRRFFATEDAVMEDAYYNVYHNACDAVWNAVGGIVTNAVWAFANYDAIYNTSYDVAFFETWNHGGVAYNIIKDYDIEYSRNLVRILEEKVNNLERLAQQLRR